MPIVYTAVSRFGPHRDDWQKFIDWSGLTQLLEVISLDSILCPSVVQELTDEDWKHNVHKNYQTHLFRDLDYLLARVGSDVQINILAVIQEPTTDDLQSFTDPRFVFRGFDLTDGSIGALVNCGGFDKAFANSNLSEFGLLTDHAKALEVQRLLRSKYPDEPHAKCDVWVIWQMMAGV